MSISSEEIKKANTLHPIHPLISKRWSARSFSDTPISQLDLDSILEAAIWAPSANNEQPWLYYYALKGTEGFEKILDNLLPGNQPWAKNAAILIAAVTRKSFETSKKENAWSKHDLGMANAQLFLQAISLDIYGHPMAGFDKIKLSESLLLVDDQEPVCVIALGYLDEAEKLEEPFKTRELTERKRKPLQEVTFRV